MSSDVKFDNFIFEVKSVPSLRKILQKCDPIDNCDSFTVGYQITVRFAKIVVHKLVSSKRNEI